MKKCPYCAEKIQDEAIVCRYCGRDLPNLPLIHHKKRSLWKTSWLILGLVVLLSVMTLAILLGKGLPHINSSTSTPTTRPRPTATLDALATAKSNWENRVSNEQPTPDFSNCISWQQVDFSYSGKTICIRGIIDNIYRQNLIAFSNVYFSDEPKTFYFYSHDENLYAGQCIMIIGTVSVTENYTPFFDGLQAIQECP